MKQSQPLGYMAIDQYGQTYHLGAGRPRKLLLDYFCRKSARKMYVDRKDGSTRHIGYIVAGLWLRVLQVHEWHGAA
jgi:hypothetical protein